MEIVWKVTNLFVGLVLIGLCSGFPIGLENSAADYHTQFLTGLVGVLLTVCGVVFLAGCLCCQRKNGFKEFHNNPVVASSTSSLDHGHINPIANGEFTIFTPLSPPHHNNNVFLANEQIVGQTEIDYNHADIDVRSWFDGTESDFPRTRLKYIKELGKGWFGRVVEGTAQSLNGSDEKQNWTPVVVRILEASATSSERAVFLHDAIIYRCGKHPHILQLLGRSLESVPLLLLQELCPRGDLKKYLRDNQGTADKLLSSELPLLWCCQLSSALKHLHDHKLTHPDLAARNCHVVSDLSIKLGDYGLAASLYPEDYYQGAPAVPVRWCAPESLTCTSTTIQPKQITFESNVWSLGVTMWEIYECGAHPYVNLSDDEVLSQVLGSANVRLSKPELSILYTDYIFRLMQLCWSTSESRPSVSQVHLMLKDLMQVYQNTKHLTNPEPPISMQDFDKRWDTFKPNSVAKTDNHEFVQESVSMADVDLSDITVLNLNLNKDEELLNTKPMSPSLNNLHGSLDNLTSGEMDSWLQKVATKTGDMSYVRGLSEAIKDLDNALALENVSSSDSSHQPSPAPENLPNFKNKLEFKLGPTSKASELNKTQNSSLTESMQRTSSESETEDENWRRKIERGAYSEKVHQKSKSVMDLMVLTHIDCSESDSETPLPSLDYRVNYKNVRYAPKQNLENISLMFGSEGNLLSVHDKFQEELRRLQEERKDSLLFVPEPISHNDEKTDLLNKDRIGQSQRGTENSSSDEETWTVRKRGDTTCTYVNTNPSTSAEQPENSQSNKNVSPNHRNPESLIEELSSPADIQPGSQVYNIFNVTVDAKFSPMHLKPNMKEIICFKDVESNRNNFESCSVGFVDKNCTNESTAQYFQVPKLTELIQNNDDLMDYIITRYESQEDVNMNPDVNVNISESKTITTTDKELNNNIQNLSSSSKSTDNVQILTQQFLQNEQQNYAFAKVHFDVSHTQEELLPSSMTHSSLCTSTPFTKRTFKHFDMSNENTAEVLQFSSNFADLDKEEETKEKSELKYSLETWDNFLGTALDGSRECSGFDNLVSEPQSLLFVDENIILSVDTVECKNQALIDNFNLKSDNALELPANVNMVALEQDVNSEERKETATCSELNSEPDLKGETALNNYFEVPEHGNNTFVVEQIPDKTFVCEDKKNEENVQVQDSAGINNLTVILSPKNEQVDGTDNEEQQLEATYTKELEVSGGSNWEPGEGWFLHPQTNSDVSGQIDVSQGGEESYVGFSMDDEIMAAIRNELLMKLPQAQGQSSEQVKDTDEWDAEGRSEVLIKYNLYTTPLSPIPEESYSENDSYHLIYNREDNSDSENEDWPEPYEEHNLGLPDTETRSMQNAESPVPEPQNRHTPSQDSCCSNDTLFNLEELTFVVNESENLKTQSDFSERKGCDLLEVNAKEAVLNKELEEPTLKVEAETVNNEENCIKELHNIPLKMEVGKDQVVLEHVSKAESVVKQEMNEETVSKNTNKFQTEIFSCNIEPAHSEKALPKSDVILHGCECKRENEVFRGKNREESSEEQIEPEVEGAIFINFEENAFEEVKFTNENLSEISGGGKKEELTPKTDEIIFTEDDIVTNFIYDSENKIEVTDAEGIIEAINEPLIIVHCNKAQDVKMSVSNFNVKDCGISLNYNEKNENIENIQNSQAINDSSNQDLKRSTVSLKKDEVSAEKSKIAEENKSANENNELDLESNKGTVNNYNVNISKTDILEDIKDIHLVDNKNNINSDTCKENAMKNESSCTKLQEPLKTCEADTTSEDKACKSVHDSEKCGDLKANEVIMTQDEINACQSVVSLINCEFQQVQVEDEQDKVIFRQHQISESGAEADLINFDKNEENIKEGEVVNGNVVAVSFGEVITGHDKIKSVEITENVASAGENSLDSFNNTNGVDSKKSEGVVHSKDLNMNQNNIISLQDTVNRKDEIDLAEIINVGDEVDIVKSEVIVHQDEVVGYMHEVDVETPVTLAKHELIEFGKTLLNEGDLNNYRNSKDLQVDQEPSKHLEKGEANFGKVAVNIVENEFNIKENGLETAKLEYCRDHLQSISEHILPDEGRRQLEIPSKHEIKSGSFDVETDQCGIENLENTKNSINSVEVEGDQNVEGVERIDACNKNAQVVTNYNEIELNKIFEDNADKCENSNKNEIEDDKHRTNIIQNRCFSNVAEVNCENININFIKQESDFAKTDNTVIKDEFEESVGRRIDSESLDSGCIEKEDDLTKTDDELIKAKAEENCSRSNNIFDVGDVDVQKNDVCISQLNIKNMQNGIIPVNSPKWSSENHTELINVSENLKEDSISIQGNKNSTNSTSSQIKTFEQAKTYISEEKASDFTDISLIVENNPNYITEFLNHERQSSISSLGSSKSDDFSDHINISNQNSKNVDTNATTESDYVTVDDITIKLAENSEPADSASYVNVTELANITANLISQPEYVNIVQREDTDEHLYDPVAVEDADVDIYDALTDIRFTGPTDVQLMSTSFSESADIDEQDWDSGSDTRSSSSGEFIWKEGEHEESVKALRAAPQDVMATEKMTPMEDIEEVSTESSEDEDGDSPEFVPSAWDKYATPTKSALRSPEKTLEKAEVQHKKPKGVWFKKQKYHCVYEYPREPENPNVNSFDLWQPVSTSLIDWEVDTSTYVPNFEGATPHSECYQQLDSHAKNLYQLADFTSGMTALDDEFFISSTARPFESFGGVSSQFFPGQTTSDQWMDLTKPPNENITPDSGVEDITPNNPDGNEFLQTPPKHQVQPLKLLATVVLKNNQISELKSNSKDALGGLRHARNKLKLDLPPSPSAFTSTKAFTIEPPEEPVTKREVPTFTTFGKSRFLVQHVDTPTCDKENESKNVSFEALPYKPVLVKEEKTKIEVVRGEASLLDSADEDSGIESSTLERKKITNVAD